MKTRLHRHLRVHSGVRPFHCPVCAKTFTYNVYLKHHLTTKHRPRSDLNADEQHDCARCGRSFRRLPALHRHARGDCGARPRVHPCPVCGRRFARRPSVESHMRVHTGARPFACPAGGCGGRFGHASNLRQHVRLRHAGLADSAAARRSFPCDGCRRTFNNEGNFRRHVCGAAAGFKCGFCAKAFRRKYTMQQHVLRTHAGGECGNCGMKFRLSGRKKIHEETCGKNEVKMEESESGFEFVNV